MHPDGGAAYTAHALDMVSLAEMDAFTPGVEVNVRFDPAKPTNVAVESLASPASA